MEVEWVRKHEEALVVSVGSMGLKLRVVPFEELPVVAVLQAGLDEDAVLVSREVLAAHNLPNEEHFGLEVGFCAQLVHFCGLFDLLLLLFLLREFSDGRLVLVTHPAVGPVRVLVVLPLVVETTAHVVIIAAKVAAIASIVVVYHLFASFSL